MNFILGSGIIGLLAKQILGWELIPFKKSRFYSYEPCLADDFIVSNPEVEDVLGGGIRDIFKRKFSFNGVLYDYKVDLAQQYIRKVYDDLDVPVEVLQSSFMVLPMSVGKLYDGLLRKYDVSIQDGLSKYGDLSNIDLTNRRLTTSVGVFDFERVVSTIPLSGLCGLCGIELGLKSSPVFCYNIMCRRVDLEGCRQVLVVDEGLEFFKVQLCLDGSYLFFSKRIIEKPYQYFGHILGFNFELVGSYVVNGSLPLNRVDLGGFSRSGITCVGSCAQWDDLIDVGGCIRKLVKLKI